MKKQTITIKTGTADEFFKRGRILAKAADRGERLPAECIVSFEDPADVMRLVTETRLKVFRTLKERPGSITDLSVRLHRDRSAVKRDIDELARAGLVIIDEKVLPGHGRMKEVRVAAACFRLQADVI